MSCLKCTEQGRKLDGSNQNQLCALAFGAKYFFRMLGYMEKKTNEMFKVHRATKIKFMQ